MIWTILWLAWFAYFLGVEIPGARRKQPGATLSEHVWQWFSVKDHRRFWLGRRIILGCFLAALFAHLTFGAAVLPVIVLGALMTLVIAVSSAKER